MTDDLVERLKKTHRMIAESTFWDAASHAKAIAEAIAKLSVQVPTHDSSAPLEPVKAADNTAGDALAHLVARFSVALLEKLRDAEKKYGHDDSWLQDDWPETCQRKLLEHVAKGDPRDVAAYCAFMWHHGWSTAAPAVSPDHRDESGARVKLNLPKDWMRDV